MATKKKRRKRLTKQQVMQRLKKAAFLLQLEGWADEASKKRVEAFERAVALGIKRLTAGEINRCIREGQKAAGGPRSWEEWQKRKKR